MVGDLRPHMPENGELVSLGFVSLFLSGEGSLDPFYRSGKRGSARGWKVGTGCREMMC